MERRLQQYENRYGLQPRIDDSPQQTISTPREFEDGGIGDDLGTKERSSPVDALHSRSRGRQRASHRHSEPSFSSPQKGTRDLNADYLPGFGRSESYRMVVEKQSALLNPSTSASTSQDQPLGQVVPRSSHYLTISNEDAEHNDDDDDAATTEKVTDGMVEYPGDSVNTEVDGSFEESPAFNFALKVKASARSDATNSTSSQQGSRRQGKSAETERTTSMPVFTAGTIATGGTPLNTRSQKQHLGDNERALQLYCNDSYLHYVPQRLVATTLVDRYFMAVHPAWPFLVEDSTRRRLDAIWSSDEPPNPIWMAQLNMIFALACLFYDLEGEAPLKNIHNAGEDFYLRGYGMVIAHAFQTQDVTLLQTMLLVVQYQQGTLRSKECWLTLGHATRTALGLGFHKQTFNSESLTCLDVEVRRRLWWGCFCFERSVCHVSPFNLAHG